MIAVPNLFFVSALLFAVGALTRKLFAVYVTGIVLLVAWQITQTDRRAARQAQARVAHRSVRAHDDRCGVRYWSVAEKNAKLIPLAGSMMQNRADLDRASAIALFCARRRGLSVFGFSSAGHHVEARKPSWSPRRSLCRQRLLSRCATISASWLRAFFSQIGFHLRSILREPPFLAISLDLRHQPDGRAVVPVAAERIGAVARDLDRLRRTSRSRCSSSRFCSRRSTAVSSSGVNDRSKPINSRTPRRFPRG